MLIKLAWRNIWRSKTRSLVVITAIALGLLAGVFASAFVEGMMKDKIESVIELEMSHYQFHHPKFRDEFVTKYYIENSDKIEQTLLEDENTLGISSRVISMVMMASANHTNGVRAVGIVPEDEAKITPRKINMIEGEYFEGVKRNPILVSKRTAEKYKLKIRSKVVLTFQDVNTEMVSSAFRVAGIFNSKNGLYDDMNVFVRKSDLQKLIGIENGAHEIAVKLKQNELAETSANKYQKIYQYLEVLPWMDLSTGMRYIIEMMGVYTIVLVGIIMVALIFSIINTMLMAVLERTREIGMLMAVGMARTKIFIMIMLESIYLSIIGGPLGLFISWLLITYFGNFGIDLGSGGEMYEDMGFTAIIYPSLTFDSYIQITIMVLVMAVLGAIYPAWKALKLNPVEAIRKI